MARKSANTQQIPSYLKGERPDHIVIFNEPSEQNIGVLRRELKLTDDKEARNVRGTVEVLSARNGVQTRVYRQLAVATVPLNPEEAQAIQNDDAVLEVVPNYQRYVPTPVTVADAEMRSGVGTDPLQAYLRGMRDAIDAVLRFQGGSPETQMPLPLPDSGGIMGIQQDNSHSWCLSLIGIPPGYKRATGKNVKVAVLDTGVDLLHPDFAGRFTEDVNARSFVEGESVQDGNGHGTHCAGVVGGPARSSSGRRYGVAPDTDLMVGKVLSNAGSGFDDQIIDGIDWAADQGAEIISMSLGSLRSVGVAHSTAYERIAAVLLQSEPSVLIIAAAGNESARPFSLAAVGNPAACPSIMAVAAVDQLRRVARFSCAELDTIGPLDVSGPGVAVFSAYKDGGFTSISGTSMATPHVAGVAALYRELDPSLTAARLRQQIMTRLTPLGIRRDFGQGLVQAP